MEKLDLYLKDLICKDENKAQIAADYMINSSDIELFKMLTEKSDFLFNFVRNNVAQRIEKAVNKDNIKNIISFFTIYSPYYDDLFASILSKHANQDLTDEIFDLLEKGTTDQKTYAAKYFSYIPDTVALELLSKYAFSDNEYLSYNSAEALGQMQDDISYDIALNSLSSDDDLEKLKAVKFFTAYGRDYPLSDIFKAMQDSKIPENIAGQIPYMESLLNLLNSGYKQETLLAIENILSGLGEILPLSDIFQFELYEVLDLLININKKSNDYSSKIAEILLTALYKFRLFCENQEYIFDEDKDTKYEISSVLKLLQGQGMEFWNIQKSYVIKELEGSDSEILAVLPVIAEFKLKDALPQLNNLLDSENEIVLCEVLSCIKNLDSLENIDINKVINKVKNPNIKAIIESYIK